MENSKNEHSGNVGGVGYADNPKNVQCSGPNCFKAFTAKKGKQYCSATCRAKAHDARRFERIKNAIIDRKIDALSDADLRILARAVASKRVAIVGNGNGKPFKPGASHKKILERIDGEPRLIFVPALEKIEGITDTGRRCRELRTAGILESIRVGRFVGYRRRVDPPSAQPKTL